MRWFHLAIIVLFGAAMVVFALQNLQVVTITFFKLSASAPLALLTIVFYLLGAATGGSLFALLRRSYASSRRSTMGA
jgi:uncharacterized integral membrane protein